MLTALIILTIATVLVLTAGLIVILKGWFPRLVALPARTIDLLKLHGETPRLDSRERSELLARLWVPL
ncbi:MAG: hypothetical protein V3S20_08910 [Dehalococcoidia bacterium]